MSIRLRQLGLRDYTSVWREMQHFTEQRTAETQDEIWLLQHTPVFTLGRNATEDHLLNPSEIPILRVDRGGQVTYHGPGQLILYLLFDLRRARMGIKDLVGHMEDAVIELLAQQGITGARKSNAPGVYVEDAKVAALGLRVRNGCTFHGLSLNVEMDLEPFTRIHPCGHQNLPVTQLHDLGSTLDLEETGICLSEIVARHLTG
jgi:lipoyl(octanoyl) transferase